MPAIIRVKRLSAIDFIPRYGEAVIVAGRNRHGDEVALIIRQPDGTLVQLPIWMTEDRAEAMMVTESPHLPLTNLRELRLKLDACLSLLRDDSRCEGGDKHKASSILSPPTRSLRGQDPAGTDSTGRADEAVATGECAAVGNTRRSRSDGGRR